MASEVKFLLALQKIGALGTLAENVASNLPVQKPQQVQGNVQVNWTYFKEQRKKYFLTLGPIEKTNAVKVATYLVMLGRESYQIHQKLALTEEQ